MTTSIMTRFVEQWPFVPFTMILTNGREVHVPHSDFMTTDRGILSVFVIVPTGQLEIIDTALIVALRTFRAAELPSF